MKKISLLLILVLSLLPISSLKASEEIDANDAQASGYTPGFNPADIYIPDGYELSNDRHYKDLGTTLDEKRQILAGNKQLAADIINKYSLVGIYKETNDKHNVNDKENLLERYYVKPGDIYIDNSSFVGICIKSSNGKLAAVYVGLDLYDPDNPKDNPFNFNNVVLGKKRIGMFSIQSEPYNMGHELLYEHNQDRDNVSRLVDIVMDAKPEKQAYTFLECFGIIPDAGLSQHNSYTLDIQFARGNVTDPTQAKNDFFSGILGDYTVKITMNVYPQNRASGELLDTVYYELPLKIIPPEHTYLSLHLFSPSGDWLCTTWGAKVDQGGTLILEQRFTQEDGVPEGYQVVGWSTTLNGPVEFPVGSAITFEQAYYSRELYAVLAPISTQPVVSPTTPVVQQPTQVAPQPTTVQTSASCNVLVAVLVITIATCGLIVVRRNK